MYHTFTKGLFSDSAILLMCRQFNLDALEEKCPGVDSLSRAEERKHFLVNSRQFPQLGFNKQLHSPQAWVTNMVFNLHIVLYIKRILIQRSASVSTDRKLSLISTSLDSSFSSVL